MAQNETEFKYQLKEADYRRLLSHVSAPLKVLVFTNRYFLADEPIARQDWVLRLRRGDGLSNELTLKIGKEMSPGVFRSLEYSACVEDDDPLAWEVTEPMEVLRREISTAPLLVHGEVINERRVVPAPLEPLGVWEVDKTEFPDGTVCYELEAEWPDGRIPTPEELGNYRQSLEAWLVSCDIRVEPSRVTKYRRFLDSL